MPQQHNTGWLPLLPRATRLRLARSLLPLFLLLSCAPRHHLRRPGLPGGGFEAAGCRIEKLLQQDALVPLVLGRLNIHKTEIGIYVDDVR